MKEKILALHGLFLRVLDYVGPLAVLVVRLHIAHVFWASGQAKIASWDSTLSLFENEYSVPFLPPEVAAYMGTAVELGMPVFLVLGLGTRFAAIVLFVFNIIAVLSYPDLTEGIKNPGIWDVIVIIIANPGVAGVGLKDHIHWGLLLLFPIFYGPGWFSVDHWISRVFRPQAK